MDTHETETSAWSREEQGDYAGEHRVDAEQRAAAAPDTEGEPIVLAEEDVVVVESREPLDEPEGTPYERAANMAAMDDAAPQGTQTGTGVPESVAPGLAGEGSAAALSDTAGTAPAAATASPSATGAAADSQHWSEIKAMFVDDPGESVKLASGLVERAIEDLVTSLRDRQNSLASWESGDDSDTEGLRNVLRSY